MLTEHIAISNAKAARGLLEDGVLRYCELSAFSVDGGQVSALIEGCQFAAVEWYWASFNCATIVSSSFEDCTFRGVSFMSCKFVECTFNRCRFLPDNLGGSCSAEESSFYGCTALNCEGWDELIKTAVSILSQGPSPRKRSRRSAKRRPA